MLLRRLSRLSKFSIFCVLLTFSSIYLLLNDSIGLFHRAKVFMKSPIMLDWQDHKFIANELTRTGPGERSAYVLTDSQEIKISEDQLDTQGVSIIASEKISVDRALPDVRSEKCKTKKYLKSLPKASVIVIFYNEVWSVLLRCLHSVYNRTPKELLHEIILINDRSSQDEIYKPLEKYLREHFGGKVKFFHNSARKGLIVTRVEGAKRASGDVIVFLDSHMEVTTNWLPPLLEPIALNRKTATVPNIDDISPETFEYEQLTDYLNGGFDWNLRFQYFGLTKDEYPQPDEPFKTAAMTGGAYAIDRKYFFELGGYDTGMFLYNAENYEMSFKLHLCGGNLLSVPCSRVGHMDRNVKPYSYTVNGTNHSLRNLRRLVEVWFDEYKFLYYRNNRKKKMVNCGDLTEPNALRKKLNCKSFKFYLEKVAPFILERYPINKQTNFASGCIRSKANEDLCITAPQIEGKTGKLERCSTDPKLPKANQSFELTWHRMLRLVHQKRHQEFCLEENRVESCTYLQAGQLFRYLPKTLQLAIDKGETFCLAASLASKTLVEVVCDRSDINQQWIFTSTNLTMLDNWKSFGARFL